MSECHNNNPDRIAATEVAALMNQSFFDVWLDTVISELRIAQDRADARCVAEMALSIYHDDFLNAGRPKGYAICVEDATRLLRLARGAVKHG